MLKQVAPGHNSSNESSAPSDPHSVGPAVDMVVHRATEESYRTIFELASDAVFIHDVETGEILDANQKACEMHGCSLAELRALGTPGISDGHPPFDGDHAAEKLRLAASGEGQRFEWLVKHSSGTRFWVEVDLNRVRILGEDRILASVRSIDHRKRAEALLARHKEELERRVDERTAELAARTSALEDAEQRFRAIVESSPIPLLISRPSDGRIFFANERLEAMIGAEPGSLVGQFTPDFYYDPSDRPRVIDMIREQGYLRDLELQIRSIDGTPIWTSVSIQRLTFGGEDAVATSFIDITQRRQALDALRASEESYRGLFDNLTELVYIQSLDGRFLNVNDAVCRTYGYTCAELVGQTPELLAAPGLVDLEQTREFFRRAAMGEPQRFDWWGRRKDGSIFPKEVVVKRSTYFGQDVVIAVARDISDRIQAEERLRQSEQHFRRMIENASDLISIMDSEGIIRYQSPSIKRLLGYEPEELVGRSAFGFIAEDDMEATLERWRLLHENPDEPVLAEFRFRHRDGSWRFMEGLGASLVPGTVDQGIIVNSRDITERKRTEAALQLQTSVLEAQGEASIDGILVVSDVGQILSHNQRFVELWDLPGDIVETKSDSRAIQAVLDKVVDPAAFEARVEYLYENPQERSRDEITLHDGRVFDRYTAPIIGSEEEYYGRIWFFRDVTIEKNNARDLERAHRMAEKARERASHYARSLERELEFGRTIQQGLFPARLPEPDGWEIAVRFHPVWQVAGDFYDAFELPSGRIGLIVADVSGKGVGAALFMALFQSLLRASAERASLPAEANDADVLQEALTSTNNYIQRAHRHAHMFASAFFGLLDPASGTLHYVNAGHEPPMHVLGSNGVARLGPTGPAVGILEDASFEVATARLAAGDTLLAFTDGVTEARDEQRDFFSEERLLQVASAHYSSAEDLLGLIDAAVHDFTGAAPPADDITMLAVRRV